nr:hypothetical protein [Actinomyces trachealis]
MAEVVVPPASPLGWHRQQAQVVVVADGGAGQGGELGDAHGHSVTR